MTLLSARMNVKSRISLIINQIVKNMLDSEIIETTTRQRCNSTIFIVHKDKDKVRPVTNYAHLRNIIVKPKSYLPSLFQIIEKRERKTNFLHHSTIKSNQHHVRI
jgi:hypothetical protein